MLSRLHHGPTHLTPEGVYIPYRCQNVAGPEVLRIPYLAAHPINTPGAQAVVSVEVSTDPPISSILSATLRDLRGITVTIHVKDGWYRRTLKVRLAVKAERGEAKEDWTVYTVRIHPAVVRGRKEVPVMRAGFPVAVSGREKEVLERLRDLLPAIPEKLAKAVLAQEIRETYEKVKACQSRMDRIAGSFHLITPAEVKNVADVLIRERYLKSRGMRKLSVMPARSATALFAQPCTARKGAYGVNWFYSSNACAVMKLPAGTNTIEEIVGHLQNPLEQTDIPQRKEELSRILREAEKAMHSVYTPDLLREMRELLKRARDTLKVKEWNYEYVAACGKPYTRETAQPRRYVYDMRPKRLVVLDSSLNVVNALNVENALRCRERKFAYAVIACAAIESTAEAINPTNAMQALPLPSVPDYILKPYVDRAVRELRELDDPMDLFHPVLIIAGANVEIETLRKWGVVRAVREFVEKIAAREEHVSLSLDAYFRRFCDNSYFALAVTAMAPLLLGKGEHYHLIRFAEQAVGVVRVIPELVPLMKLADGYEKRLGKLQMSPGDRGTVKKLADTLRNAYGTMLGMPVF